MLTDQLDFSCNTPVEFPSESASKIQTAGTENMQESGRPRPIRPKVSSSLVGPFLHFLFPLGAALPPHHQTTAAAAAPPAHARADTFPLPRLPLPSSPLPPPPEPGGRPARARAMTSSSSSPSRKVRNPKPPPPPIQPLARSPPDSTDLPLPPFAWAFLAPCVVGGSGAEQDRVQPPAEGALGVAGQPARRLQAQGHRQPPEVPILPPPPFLTEQSLIHCLRGSYYDSFGTWVELDAWLLFSVSSFD